MKWTSSCPSNVSINSHFKDLSLILKGTSFNSLQDWITGISSKLPWEKIGKQDSKALIHIQLSKAVVVNTRNFLFLTQYKYNKVSQ